MPSKTKCGDCDERLATTVRDGERMCAECAADYDKPAEIHEPTIARVRRDVEQYKCQAAWLDTWSLLRMFDRLRADLARAGAVVSAARALVEQTNPSTLSSVDEVTRRLWDALARELAGGDGYPTGGSD